MYIKAFIDFKIVSTCGTITSTYLSSLYDLLKFTYTYVDLLTASTTFMSIFNHQNNKKYKNK